MTILLTTHGKTARMLIDMHMDGVADALKKEEDV